MTKHKKESIKRELILYHHEKVVVDSNIKKQRRLEANGQPFDRILMRAYENRSVHLKKRINLFKEIGLTLQDYIDFEANAFFQVLVDSSEDF